ncbi:lipid A deacylase LpxR family protein [Sulfurimonas sp.]|uniref:lipid A deacylase LpxR family protein n=1 Tax=Sulfurimonas sp. TaxID=2022749 RepID=UPI003565DD8E
MKHKKKLLSLLVATTLSADQFSFQLYNDFFAGTDQHFTNGVAFSWLDNAYENNVSNSITSYSNLMIDTFETLSPNGLDKSKRYSAGASLSQIIITPIDTTLSTPQYDDIPYAGYLALSGYIFEWDEKSFNELRIELGVVGKESLAQEVQDTFHNIIRNHHAKGWDTQIEIKYTLNLLYRYGETSWKSNKSGSLSIDWFNHTGFEFGNFEIRGFAGTMFRIGDNYIQNFNVHYPYLKEEAGLLEIEKNSHGFGWALSTGINGEIVGYSYIIDQAQKDGYDISNRTFNVSLYVGAELYYNVHKLSYFYQSHSPYTNEQNNADTYGSFMYSYQF